MELYADIDGPCACTNFPTRLRSMNGLLQLGLSEQDIASIKRWPDFWKHPQVKAFVGREGQERALERVKRTALHPAYVATCLEVEGACAGMTTLQAFGTVGYLTSRASTTNGVWGEKLREATLRWLSDRGFPGSDHLTCVYPFVVKLTFLIERVRVTGERVLLIDDLAERLVRESETLKTEDRHVLRQQVGVWAFGKTRHDPIFSQGKWVNAPFIELLPFPSWKHVAQLVQRSSLLQSNPCEKSERGVWHALVGMVPWGQSR